MNDNNPFSHLAPGGEARMVDVSEKSVTHRQAIAEAWVDVGGKIAEQLRHTGGVAKGNVLETARLAGIMAAARAGQSCAKDARAGGRGTRWPPLFHQGWPFEGEVRSWTLKLGTPKPWG